MIDKNKFRSFIANFLNQEYETDSFFPTKKDEQKYGLDVFSPVKKIGVHFRIENFDDGQQKAFNDLMSSIKPLLDKIKLLKIEIDKLIIISTYKDDSLVFEYIQLLKNEHKYPFEIDFWGWDTVSKYLETYQHLLPKSEDKTKISKFLTDIPSIKLSQIIAAEKNQKQIHETLNAGGNAVIHGILSGTGKSANALYYAHSQKYNKNYKHIVYVNFVQELKLSFINAFEKNSIGFNYVSEYTIFENFKKLIEKLKKIEGENLLIIDNVTKTNQVLMVYDLLKELKWKILVTADRKITNFQPVEISPLTKQQAKTIFLNHYKKEINSEMLDKILVRINNNPFLAYWLAKKTNSDNSLNLGRLYLLLKAKDRKSHHFNNYINYNSSLEEQAWQRQFLKYVLAVYEHQVKQISATEKKYLALLSAMPQKYFSFDEIVEILSLKNAEKERFAEIVVNLISSGWLEANKEKFYFNPVVKSILHKKLKPNHQKLAKTAKNLIGIIYRTNENQKYIPYAESVVATSSMRDANIANLTYNLAQSYEEIGAYDYAQMHFYDVAEIFENFFYQKEPDDKLAENISQIYFKIENFEKALEFSEIALDIRQNNYDENDEKIAITYQALALIYEKLEEYEQAIEMSDNSLDILQEIYDQHDEQLAQANALHNYLSMQYEEMLRRKNRWYWLNKYFS